MMSILLQTMASTTMKELTVEILAEAVAALSNNGATEPIDIMNENRITMLTIKLEWGLESVQSSQASFSNRQGSRQKFLTENKNKYDYN